MRWTAILALALTACLSPTVARGRTAGQRRLHGGWRGRLDSVGGIMPGRRGARAHARWQASRRLPLRHVQPEGARLLGSRGLAGSVSLRPHRVLGEGRRRPVGRRPLQPVFPLRRRLVRDQLRPARRGVAAGGDRSWELQHRGDAWGLERHRHDPRLLLEGTAKASDRLPWWTPGDCQRCGGRPEYPPRAGKRLPTPARWCAPWPGRASRPGRWTMWMWRPVC